MELLANMNWLAVLLGAIIYMVVGGIWYGPIAGKAWMAEMGLTEEEIKESGSPAKAMLQAFVAALFLSAGLEFILSMQSFADGGWFGGMQVGFVLAILIIGGGTFANYAFENKSLRHFLIHVGNVTLAMMAMGAMMGAWS